MADGPGDRYLLPALLTLYEVEPTLRDVFVEGRTDRGFYSWYLEQHGIAAEVYDVDSRVFVEADYLSALGLDVGARGRAISVGMQADAALGADQRSVTVIVDADFSHVFGSQPGADGAVLYTDVPDLEVYALEWRPLEKFLRVVAHAPRSVTAQAVLDALTPVLVLVFAVRAVLHQYAISLVQNFVRVCDLSYGGSSVDVRELVTRSMGAKRKEVGKSVEDLVSEALAVADRAQETQQLAHGHDIAPALRRLLNLKGGLGNDEAVEASLRACLTVEDLDHKALFSKLVARMN